MSFSNGQLHHSHIREPRDRSISVSISIISKLSRNTKIGSYDTSSLAPFYICTMGSEKNNKSHKLSIMVRGAIGHFKTTQKTSNNTDQSLENRDTPIKRPHPLSLKAAKQNRDLREREKKTSELECAMWTCPDMSDEPYKNYLERPADEDILRMSENEESGGLQTELLSDEETGLLDRAFADDGKGKMVYWK